MAFTTWQLKTRMMGIGAGAENLLFQSRHLAIRSPPQEMRCYMKAENEYGENADVLVMQDTTTDEIVLEVGTENYDDWYPCCHFEYHPEGMACNSPVITDDDFSRILMS